MNTLWNGCRRCKPRYSVEVVPAFLLTNGRRVVTPIAAPHELPTARYFRLRAAAQGWETVFFVPDRDTIQGGRTFDAGAHSL